MYNKIHDHLKTLLLLILVIYAFLNYQEKNEEVIVQTEWNTLINQYEIFNTFDAIINYLNDEEASQQYFDDSHPII